MDYEQFLKSYNPKTICIATYKSKHGDIQKGFIIDELQNGASNTPFLWIDNLSNQVLLTDVLEVIDSGRAIVS